MYIKRIKILSKNIPATINIKLNNMKKEETQSVVPTNSDWRQKLFDYMDKEHDVQLLDSDMDEIHHICFPPDYPYVVSPVVKPIGEPSDKRQDILIEIQNELLYHAKRAGLDDLQTDLMNEGIIAKCEEILKPVYFSKPIIKDWDEVNEKFNEFVADKNFQDINYFEVFKWLKSNYSLKQEAENKCRCVGYMCRCNYNVDNKFEEWLVKAKEVIQHSIIGLEWNIENNSFCVSKADYEHLDNLKLVLAEYKQLSAKEGEEGK